MAKTRFCLFAAAAFVARPAAAQSAGWEPGQETAAPVSGEVGEPRAAGESDGVYGRFDGDLDLGVGAGVELGDGERRGAARLALSYFSTLGLALGYADALGSDAERFERIVSVDLEVRPTFIARWSKNMQQGPAWLDLVLDSFSLGAGAYFAQAPEASFGGRRGLELVGGFGVPLGGSAAGPWLEGRSVLRWPDPARGASERFDAAVLATLSWHAPLLSPLAAKGKALSE